MTEKTDQSTLIINTTDATFEEDVIERSKKVPVVVDFWATWCQPCRMLAPILEKLVEEYDGKFVLVKADGDHCPQATAQFNVQAYPTVFGVRGGDPVDYFAGLLPEQQLRQWIERLLPSDMEKLVMEAEQLKSTDPAAAIEKLQQATQAQPNDLDSKLKLAELLTDCDRLNEARQVLEELQEIGYETTDVMQLLSAVQVKRSGEQSGGSAACRAACEENPDDLSLKLNLAEALAAEGQYQEALDLALGVLQTDKANHGERARTTMLGVFNILPDDSELTHEYRRKLSAALY